MDIGTYIDLTHLNKRPVGTEPPQASSWYDVGTHIKFIKIAYVQGLMVLKPAC